MTTRCDPFTERAEVSSLHYLLLEISSLHSQVRLSQLLAVWLACESGSSVRQSRYIGASSLRDERFPSEEFPFLQARLQQKSYDHRTGDFRNSTEPKLTLVSQAERGAIATGDNAL